MRTIFNIIHIDSENQTIKSGVVGRLEDMQELVGGYIERAMTLPNGDELFVNEEGLFKNPNFFFRIEGCLQPLCGNAYLIGATTEDGDSTDVTMSVEELKKKITFLGLKEF